MYCINCGVKLAATEERCPLCGTIPYHPTIQVSPQPPLYPTGKIPRTRSARKAISGAVIIVFLVPLILSFISDLQANHRLDWFGYVAGALTFSYLALALPLWFQKPNPVIFVPCSFAAAALYVLYINLATGGHWFLGFAFPVLGGACCITCTVVTLTHYLKRGFLYIYGGAAIGTGGLLLLTEFLLHTTFDIRLIGWSVYPLTVLALLGGLLIYVGISPAARETLSRKLFF